MENETQILIKIKNRNKTAFRELLNNYHPRISNYVYSLIYNKDDCQDLVQEVFIKVWKKINRFDINKNFSPWIYKIATNLCKDYWKANSNKQNLHETFLKNLEFDTKPKSLTEININDIISVLRLLPKKQKMVYLLKDIQQLNIHDISLILGISKSSVKTNLFYARKSLHQHLTKINQENTHELS